MDKLLTADEAASLLRVSTRTIYFYIKTGRLKAARLPSVKGWGDWRIKESDCWKAVFGK